MTRGDRFVQVLIGGVPMLVTELLIIYAGWNTINAGPHLLLLAVAAATVAVAVAVYSHTESFPLYALAVFLGVGVVIAFSTYERTHAETKVSAFAAIQSGSPVTGFFVAETSDAVYFAVPSRKATTSLALDHHAITLVRIPKNVITGMTVGPLMKETGASIRSLQLALALCESPKNSAKTTATTTTKKGAALLGGNHDPAQQR